MRLINDKYFFENQITWFEKQIKSMDIVNFSVKRLSEKDNKIREILNGSSIKNKHLDALRDLLSDTGVKKLSNSLASAKKRKISAKKSLQLMLHVETISKLEKLAAAKSMSISEWIESI